MFLQIQNPIDPTLPATMPVESVPGWPLQIDLVLENLFTPATPPLLAMGNNLWTGLSLIVVVWTGARIAFAGASFRPWDLITLIIGLTIPLTMLRFYAVDVPGVGMPFPLIIPAGAETIAQAFQTDMATELQRAQTELSEAYRQNLNATMAGEGMPSALRIGAYLWALTQNAVAWTQTFAMALGFGTAFILIYALCLAQVIWAKVALAILVYLGPVLIPWLVFQPMAFLFWGWFRALWTYSFYSIIAAAVLRIFGAICITLIQSMNAAVGVGAAPADGPEMGQFVLAVIPLLAAAFMAAMKVPELASAIVGSSSGGGIAGAAAMAMTQGKAKLGKMATGGLK